MSESVRAMLNFCHVSQVLFFLSRLPPCHFLCLCCRTNYAHCATYLFNGSRLFDAKWSGIVCICSLTQVNCDLLSRARENQRQRQQKNVNWNRKRKSDKWKQQRKCEKVICHEKRERRNRWCQRMGADGNTKNGFSLKLFPLYLLWFLFVAECRRLWPRSAARTEHTQWHIIRMVDAWRWWWWSINSIDTALNFNSNRFTWALSMASPSPSHHHS